MALLTQTTNKKSKTSSNPAPIRSTKKDGKKVGFWESQKLAKQRVYEKQASKKKIKLDTLTIFAQQLASMLEAGLPLVSCLDALQEQVDDPVFAVVIRNVKTDINSGSSFSDAVRKYPNAFPNLFSSMVEAGEASGGLADMMGKVGEYFEASLKLKKKVKSAMAYPIAVITIAIVLVYALLTFVIPVFAEMFSSFGKDLPAPTQLLIDISNFLGSLAGVGALVGLIVLGVVIVKLSGTPKGRIVRDRVIVRLPIIGNLTRKISLSRFCRTYSILIRSGVPILQALDICSRASNNTFIEDACKELKMEVSSGGQLSDVFARLEYFTPSVKHMARAGESTGNVDGMMSKLSDFFDDEVDNIVSALTSLMEPILIVVLGTIVGSIVIAMFLPIFQLSSVVG